MTIFKVPTNYKELGKLQRAPKFEHLDMEHVEWNGITTAWGYCEDAKG